MAANEQSITVEKVESRYIYGFNGQFVSSDTLLPIAAKDVPAVIEQISRQIAETEMQYSRYANVNIEDLPEALQYDHERRQEELNQKLRTLKQALPQEN